MTSLGLLQYSEINDNSAINSMTDTEKKKQARHNITIKKRHETNGNGVANGSNSENVQNMLKLINNSNGYENDDNSGLADFNPPPRAEVSTKTQSVTESTQNNIEQNSIEQNSTQNSTQNKKNMNIDVESPTIVMNRNEEPTTDLKPRQYPAPLDSYEGFNSSPKYASDYYKQYVP